MSDHDPIGELTAMIETFLRGDDQSISLADKIAQYLIEQFPEDDELKDLLLALASYSPSGGNYLYDKQALAKVMQEALALLRQREKE